MEFNLNGLRQEWINKKCLVIGDVMLDQFYYGSVDRISPEAPIPIVRVCDKKISLGGAGNVASSIAAFGIQTVLFGMIGDDIAGKLIIEELDKSNIRFSGVIKKELVTTTKTRIVGKAQQIVRFDEEIVTHIGNEDLEVFKRNFLEQVDDTNIIVISDYKKGFCTEELSQFVISEAKKYKIPVVVDPKEVTWEKYIGATIITPNFSEFCQSIGHEVTNNEENIELYSRQLIKQYDIDNVLVTRSEYGMTLVNETLVRTFQTEAKEVYDVSGAGDTVIAVLTVFLSVGHQLQDAVEMANMAAGLAVEKTGTYAVTIGDLEERLEVRYDNPLSKIITITELRKKLDESHIQKVVFTNGCFDIIHAGHVRLLNSAKRLGDILVVGLNSDESVRRLKGKERPINSEGDRSYMIASFSAVDYVIIFDEDTPYELLEKLRPDVLVKGGDYQLDEIIGREFAKDVKLLPFLEGHSTTTIINKLREEDRDE